MADTTELFNSVSGTDIFKDILKGSNYDLEKSVEYWNAKHGGAGIIDIEELKKNGLYSVLKDPNFLKILAVPNYDIGNAAIQYNRDVDTKAAAAGQTKEEYIKSVNNPAFQQLVNAGKTDVEAAKDINDYSTILKNLSTGKIEDFNKIFQDPGLMQQYLGATGLGREYESLTKEKQTAYGSQLDSSQYQSALSELTGFAKDTKTDIGKAGTIGSTFDTAMTGKIGEIGKISKDTTDLLSDYREELSTLNKGLGKQFKPIEADIGKQFGDVQSRLRTTAFSTLEDPIFKRFKEAQFSQLSADELASRQNQSEFFQRRGIAGTSASMNAEQQSLANAARQKELLTSQLGMQEMGRSDTALQQLLGATAQRAGLESGLIGQQTALSSGLTGQQAGLAEAGGSFGLGALGQQAGLQQSQAAMGLGVLGQQAGLRGQQAGFLTAASDLNRQNIMDKLGIEQLGIGSRNAAIEAQLGALSAGIETASLPATLGMQQQSLNVASGMNPDGSPKKKAPPKKTGEQYYDNFGNLQVWDYDTGKYMNKGQQESPKPQESQWGQQGGG